MRNVVIGFVGVRLDAGTEVNRWDVWRPTVSVCRHEDLVVHRLELLHGRRHRAVAEQVRADILAVSPETEVRLHVVDPRDAWDFQDVYGALHDFARGYTFDPANERYLVHITTGTHVAQICLFLLTESRHFPGMLLQSSPPPGAAKDQPGRYAIIDLDLSRYDALAARFAREQRDSTNLLKSGIATRNAAFNAMIDDIERVATRSRSPLLLMGPTGAGKSQLARRIYELKRARHQLEGPFVEVNCATLRGDAAMSTLFGHARGAFTGALAERPGLLRAADGGALFLDEIGELGLDEQAMLLRAIEEKRFFPLGSDAEVASDFQLLAGTHRDLSAAVREGRFREDLLARIHLWSFTLPALRERPEDIEPNIDYELERHTESTGAALRFNAEARSLFVGFATSAEARWTGNFRELSAAITRMATLSEGGRISEVVVREEIARLRRQWAAPPSAGRLDLQRYLSAEAVAALDEFDRCQLEAVIEICLQCNTAAEAGRRLFAASRLRRGSRNDSDRVRKYLARFGIEWSALRSAA